MKKYLFMALLVLQGCEPSDNHGYGWHYDWQGESGLRVRVEDGAERPQLDTIKPDQSEEDVAFLLTESAYLRTIECTRLAPPTFAPLVIFTANTLDTADHAGQSRYYRDTGLIVVRSLPEYPRNWSIVLFKHQLIHLLLHQAQAPADQDESHGAAVFSECG